MTNVFIAPKIKVGYQKREDTFTGKLAYIIYYDEKGKLRKEKSWNSWRDHKIAAQEFDNAPMDGFTLNKDIKRYNGEWFSSHRTMIRVHDPRGFEFEITTENLIGILMHTDCLRRGLIGQFVYAWVGPELVLLPTNSEEYQAAVKYSGDLSKKVKAKELIDGVSYKTKREGDVVFIGRFNWYEYSGKNNYSRTQGPRKEEKVMVFTKDDGKSFFKKTSVEFLAEANSTTPLSNYAKLVDKFNNKSYANKIVRFEFCPVVFDESVKKEPYYGFRLSRQNYFVESNEIPGIFTDCFVTVRVSRANKLGENQTDEYTIDGYEFQNSRFCNDNIGIRQADMELVHIPVEITRSTNVAHNIYNYPFHDRKPYDLVYMQLQKFYDLFVVFENNKRRKINSIYELTSEDY